MNSLIHIVNMNSLIHIVTQTPEIGRRDFAFRICIYTKKKSHRLTLTYRGIINGTDISLLVL